MFKKLFIYAFLILLLSSCQYIFDSIAHDGSCQVCELKRKNSYVEDDVISTYKQCEGHYSKAEEDCKLAAYDEYEILICDCYETEKN